MTAIFYNAAMLVHGRGKSSCEAIYLRAGHGFSLASRRYRLMFEPHRSLLWWARPDIRAPLAPENFAQYWWNRPDTPATREARVYALLLAHNMAATGDL